MTEYRYEKPWAAKPHPRKKWDTIIIMICVAIGVGLSALIMYHTWSSAPHFNYCLVWDEQFEKLDTDIWSHEIQLDGFGTGSFDWTTDDARNAYVDSEGLHIVPTLTTESTSITADQLANGYTLNLTADATCTSNSSDACALVSNSTAGIILPPVRSARLVTKGKKFLTYGRVEVEAKMPRGDWLWPAIW